MTRHSALLCAARLALSIGLLPARAQSAAAACEALKHLRVPSTEIGLPTGGAAIRSAHLTHTGEGSRRVEFCKVLGTIRSVDPAAQPIRFEINLPTQWNGKALHFGGGGFDGSLSTTNGLKTQEVGIKRDATPLERGFVTFGSDSGHHHRHLLLPDVYNELEARFALNDEQRRNFAHDGLKKVHDTAVAIIRARYGNPPKRMFFMGGSTGGREAYFVTQLFPEDYDGVLGAYAGWNQVELDLQFIRVAEAEYRSGDKLTRGWLPPATTRLVAGKVMAACDALDGARDGLISDPAGCRFNLQTLSCPAGKASKDCLTPGQLQSLTTFATEQRTAQPLFHGVQSIPGFNVTSGADLTGNLGLLRRPLHPPIFLLNSFAYIVGDGVLRFFLTKDPKFNALAFDTTTGGAFADKLLGQSVDADASDADLTRFARHGGKFLMLHGTADATIPTNASVEFYKMLQTKMRAAELDRFVRFYLVPGYGHARGVFDAGFDGLGILDRWIETGQPPTDLVVTDNNGKSNGRTRPLCPYPSWPKYVGGDVNLAASFACTKPLP